MSDASKSQPRRSAWLGIDVGGANLKACHEGGSSRTSAFEVWRKPEELGRAIGELAEGLPPFDKIALTMTAEFCDCYVTKAEGVNAVVDAVAQALPGLPVAVWGIDGKFHEVSEIRRRPLLAAAANWLALATVAAGLVRHEKAMLIDVGSTTTDLVPLDRGKVAAIGRSDTERLRTGELVYAGVRRTPVCALATELPFRGQSTGLAAEHFATTLDVFLMLGEIEPDPVDRSTADGRPATIECARDRLARMVGADRGGFSEDDARSLARSAEESLMRRLETCAHRVCKNTIGRPEVVVVSGTGEFVARRLAQSLLGEGRADSQQFPGDQGARENSHPALRTVTAGAGVCATTTPPTPPLQGGDCAQVALLFPPLAKGGKVGEASPILSLAESWGALASTAACACAILLLASESSFDHVPNQN